MQARIMVITIPDEAATAMIVTSAREINPDLRIITRVSSVEGVEYMQKLGAHHIVHPELEGGLEIVRHTLLELDYPLQEVYRYTETVRHDQYNTDINSVEEYYSLQDLLNSTGTIGITWVTIIENSPIIGKSLLEANIRAATGASVVASDQR